MSKLTAKQDRFCEEYIIDLNATQAAIRAGYSKKTAFAQASRLLSNVKVQSRIQELRKEASERSKVSIDELVSMLTSMARFDIADCFNEDGIIKPIHEIPKETRLAIESLEIEELFGQSTLIGHTKKLKTSSRRANIIELLKVLGGYEKDHTQAKNNITIFKIPDNGRG